MAADGSGYALNHMCAPGLNIAEFFGLAAALGMGAVEIRNDLQGNAILDGTPPQTVAREARARRLRILSINALQRFNDWSPERAEEARGLISYAAACGAEALVLVPVNDGSGRANGERQANLRLALKQLKPMLQEADIVGLVEPLGFESCSLRLKSEAAEAIRALGIRDTFRIVHDTFHHRLAGEAAIFPDETGLVHISGVADPAPSLSEMRDGHRVLVDGNDRLDNVGQIASLRAAGVTAPLSFEPFAAEVHAVADPREAIARSVAFIEAGLRRSAA